jgi:nitrogen fixation protein FixH
MNIRSQTESFLSAEPRTPTVTKTMNTKQIAERRAKRFWVTLVVTLLGIQLTIGAVAIRLATGDPSVAIVPDYHTTALNWDREQRVNTAANRLGWKISVEASDLADASGNRAMIVTVIDDSSRAADGLQVRGKAYHHALASDVRNFQFESIGEGKYQTLAPIGRAGLWQLDVAVDGAEEPMRLTKTIEIPHA